MAYLSMFAFTTSSMFLFHPALNHVTPRVDYSRSSLLVLRCAAVVSFLTWLWFMVWRLRTHSDLFYEEDFEYESDRTPANGHLPRNILEISQPTSSLRSSFRRSYRFVGSYDPNTPMYRPRYRTPQPNIPRNLMFWLYRTLSWLIYVSLLVFCIDSLVAALLRFPSRFQTLFCLFGVPLLLKPRLYIHAIVCAEEDFFDKAIEATLGTGICVALAVGPLLVVTGWILSTPMTLMIGILETAAYGIAVWIIMIFVRRQRSTYMDGSMLVGIYVILALGLGIYI